MAGESADVVIIGAGVMGCAVGRDLARRGLRVIILEKAVPGAEASSAAAGILGAQAESDGPGPFCQLLLKSRALYAEYARQLEEETSLPTGYSRCGSLLVAFSEHEITDLEERAQWNEKLGLRAQFLSRAALAEAEPNLSPQIQGGLLFEDDGQVEPPLLARALSKGARVAGARFVQTTVQEISRSGSKATGVVTSDGTIACGKVVVAAGAWSCEVKGSGLPHDTVQPARGQVVALDRDPGFLRHVVIRHGKGYLVPRVHGRILAGSTMEYVGFHKAVTAGGMRGILELAVEVAPELAAATLGTSWANFRPATADLLPLLGEGPIRGVFFASGHFRNGILLTPVTAQVLGALIAGEDPGIDLGPFSPARFSEDWV